MRGTGQSLVVESSGDFFLLTLQVFPNSYSVATPKEYIQKQILYQLLFITGVEP